MFLEFLWKLDNTELFVSYNKAGFENTLQSRLERFFLFNLLIESSNINRCHKIIIDKYYKL